MPLNNNADKDWWGWLVDGLGGQEEECQNKLVSSLKARNIPKTTIKTGEVNMWWRNNSRYIDLVNTLDGNVMITIHLQEYGSSLWIGRAVDSIKQWNYYRRMAASAFVETVDRCIKETILTMVDPSAIRDVRDAPR